MKTLGNTQNSESGIRNGFQRLCCRGVSICCFLIIAVCFYHAIGQTGYNPKVNGSYEEAVFFKADSILVNIFWMAIYVCAVFLIIYILQKVSKNNEKLWNRLFVLFVMLISGMMSLVWVMSLHEYPQGDQYEICVAAMQMNAGDYSSLQKGGYAAIYQQQLGIITLLRILFKLFGDMRWIVFQMLNAVFIPILVYAGYRITRILSEDNQVTEKIYLLMVVTFIPMYVYSGYVYGEIISTALSMVGVWLFLECYEHVKWYKLVGVGITLGIAVQLRENCIIIVIAMVLVSIITTIRGEIKSSIALIASIVLGVALAWGIIHQGIYAEYIGENVESMPSSLHIAMGTNDDMENAGYYNVYNWATFAQCDYNAVEADKKAKQALREFAQKCVDNPDYMIDFYTRKIVGQWNVPMLQSLPLNGKYDESRIGGIAKVMYSGNLGSYAQDFMNIWQQVLYAAVALALWKTVRKWEKIELHVLPITIIGGFLFSVLWEAKARYIFAYMLFLIPIAAVGLQTLLLQRRRK